MQDKEQKLRDELSGLQNLLSAADAYSKPDFADNSRRVNELEAILAIFDQKLNLETQIADAKELIEADDDPEITEMAKTELEEIQQKLVATEESLDNALAPKDPNDHKNVIIEIRAGAGGDEASLFAGDLFRMYTRYAESNKLKNELISESPNEVGGFKEVAFSVKGESPYAKLKFESGVHRVQRVPTTESSGRIHTSTATVAVMPEAEEADIEINAQDLKIDTYRASGHGGQSVNTTDSAVRITHLPSGIVVTCQDEKSQIKNKDKAMKVLRSRLLAAHIEEQQAQEADQRRKLIGSGDRSEKIRTYNIPQDRITDHRVGYSRSSVNGALDGDFQDIIDELSNAERELYRSSK